MNNEVVGISAELAIADAFDVYVKLAYRHRGDEKIKNRCSPTRTKKFTGWMVHIIRHAVGHCNGVLI